MIPNARQPGEEMSDKDSRSDIEKQLFEEWWNKEDIGPGAAAGYAAWNGWLARSKLAAPETLQSASIIRDLHEAKQKANFWYEHFTKQSESRRKLKSELDKIRLAEQYKQRATDNAAPKCEACGGMGQKMDGYPCSSCGGSGLANAALDTPRTDEFYRLHSHVDGIWVDFARQLERELAEARDLIEWLRSESYK